MSRRVNLPGASELFRRTETGEVVGARLESQQTGAASSPTTPEVEASHSGRVRHDEKMTVYVSLPELDALERARLTLRAEHGLKVDRGRIVRAAVAQALADLAERGGEADLVRRLRED